MWWKWVIQAAIAIGADKWAKKKALELVDKIRNKAAAKADAVLAVASAKADAVLAAAGHKLDDKIADLTKE